MLSNIKKCKLEYFGLIVKGKYYELIELIMMAKRGISRKNSSGLKIFISEIGSTQSKNCLIQPEIVKMSVIWLSTLVINKQGTGKRKRKIKHLQSYYHIIIVISVIYQLLSIIYINMQRLKCPPPILEKTSRLLHINYI